MNRLNTRVTVVILTHDRTFEVMRTVERMSQLAERPPIIVVDNASRDDVGALLRRRFPAVNVMRLHENIGAAARNAGVQSAATPYVAFCDDDMFWAPGSLARAVRMLDRHPGLAAVTARVLAGPKGPEEPASRRLAASPLPSQGLPGRAVLGFVPGACVFRRYAYLQAGGYEEKLFMGGEEALLALDLVSRGWSLAYSDALRVHHLRSSLRDTERRQRLSIRNALWVAWLRRSSGSALQITVRMLWRALCDPVLRAGVVEAFSGLSWALGHRRAVPARVEQQCALLEKSSLAAPPSPGAWTLRDPAEARRSPTHPTHQPPTHRPPPHLPPARRPSTRSVLARE